MVENPIFFYKYMENLPAPKTETPLQRLRRAVSRVPLFPRKKFVQPDLDDREILFNPDTYHPSLISPGSISKTHPDRFALKEEVRDLKDLETDLSLEDEFYIPDIGDISPPQLHSDNSFNNFGIIPDVNRIFSTSPPSEGLTSDPTGIWDERRNEDQRRNKDQRPDEDQSRQTNDEAKRPNTPWEEPIQVNKVGLTNFDNLVRIASPVQQPTTNSVQQPIINPVQQPIVSPVKPPKTPKNSRANRTFPTTTSPSVSDQGNEHLDISDNDNRFVPDPLLQNPSADFSFDEQRYSFYNLLGHPGNEQSLDEDRFRVYSNKKRSDNSKE